MNSIELKDDLITLRPLKIADAPQVLAAVRESMAALEPWMPWAYPGYSVVDSEGWIKATDTGRKEGLAYEFAITDARDGAFIGGCGLNHINKIDKVANLGYWVRTSRHKQGIATRAAKLLIQYGLKELKLNRIEILASVDNHASRKTAEKAGGVREAILRHRLALPDGVHDSFLFSIVPSDFNI